MKLNIISVISFATAMAFAASGCSDDDFYPEYPVDETTSSPLRFDVDAFTVAGDPARSAEPSDTPEPESDDEKKIRDFWLFQFNPDGTKLAAPVYYEIRTGVAGKETLDELTKAAYNDLTADTPMTIYIVTNTHNSTWASGKGFDTLENVKAQKLPNPIPFRAGYGDREGFINEKILIPMSGQIDNVTKTGSNLIVVPVTRMYAKLKILVDFKLEGLKIYDVDVTGIPNYCKVSPLVDKLDENGEPMAVPFPDNTIMVSRSLKSTDAIKDKEGKDWLVIYIPENIKGEVAGADKAAIPAVNVPDNALAVNIRAKYKGISYNYLVYPGENATNNFNVRRNCVYRVRANITGITDQHTPSSNCFVVEPKGMLQFEPYNRVEKGGGFKIEDYLNPDDVAKKIEKVEIIWQTKDCIGDNTNGDLVYLEGEGPDQTPYTGEEKYRKIIVHTNKEGNALVAARNKAGEIVWSWHIWVTDNEPDNLANAIVYTTYRWESGEAISGNWKVDPGPIHSDERIPGYSVMPCNLGALEFTGKSEQRLRRGDKFCDSEVRTFGMLYQWGRKDPFPPVICFTEGSAYTTGNRPTYPWGGAGDVIYHMGFLDYTEEYAGYHYKNDNKSVAYKTHLFKDENNSEFVFYSMLNDKLIKTDNVENPIDVGIRYGIAHPTVYIAATDREVDEDNRDNPAYEQEQPYYNGGDWLPDDHDDTLWGGLPPNEAQKTLRLLYRNSDGTFLTHLYDNYGTEKSIFDPCPMGWRVAPADLWLGFTKYGIDPSHPDSDDNIMDEVNWDKESSGYYGMTMYLQGWHIGPSYFPLQGTRAKLGRGFSTGYCGNYQNATCGDNSEVNILHLHQNSLRFHIFEYILPRYRVKSTANPVRCVRDRK